MFDALPYCVTGRIHFLSISLATYAVSFNSDPLPSVPKSGAMRHIQSQLIILTYFDGHSNSI